VHWLVYRTAQRLAVVSDPDPASVALAGEVLGLAAPVPKAVSRQTVRGRPDWAQIAGTAMASKADVVYWTGTAAHAGALAAALHEAGYDGAFVASSQSEGPAFLAAAGAAAEGAFVVTPASPQNLPGAAAWTKRFSRRFGHAPGRDAMHAYDALRALAQAVTQSGRVDPRLNSAQLPRLDDTYPTFLGGALQFAADHTVKYDDNIVLTVRAGAFTVDNTLRSNAG
jgi:branched-chain amino acid transport system substrate-binding protein